MFQPRLATLFRALGEEGKAGILARLYAGVDFNGKALPPKKHYDGDALGGDRVPAQIAAADVRPRADGFSVTAHGIEVTVFAAGRKRGTSIQVARKVMGFSRAERRRWTELTADELAKQITTHIGRGAA